MSSRLQVARPIALSDGTTINNVSYADAVAALRKFSAASEEAALPDFKIPQQSTDRHKLRAPFSAPQPPVIENVAALIRPGRQFSRTDRVIAWSPPKLSIYSPGQTTPSYEINAVAEQPTGAAWLDKRLLLWTTNKISLADENGKVQWEQSSRDMPVMAGFVQR